MENKTNKSETNIWLCLIASHFLPCTIHSPSYLWSAAPLLVSPSPGASNFLPPPTHLSPRLRPPSRVGEGRRGVGNVEHFFARDLLLSVHVNFLSKLAHLQLWNEMQCNIKDSRQVFSATFWRIFRFTLGPLVPGVAACWPCHYSDRAGGCCCAAGCSDAVSSAAQFPSTFCREFPSNCRKNAKLAAPENKPVSVMTGYTINIKNPNRLMPPLPHLAATRHGEVFKNSSGFTGNWIILHIYISSHENQYCNISWIFIWQTENISFNSNVLLDIQIFSAKSQVLEMINSYRSLYSLIVSMNSMNCKIMHIGELRGLPLHISLWSWCNEIKISWSLFFSISTSTPCN